MQLCGFFINFMKNNCLIHFQFGGQCWVNRLANCFHTPGIAFRKTENDNDSPGKISLCLDAIAGAMIFAAKRIVRSACCFLPRSQAARASLLSNCVANTSFKYLFFFFFHNVIFSKPPPFVGVPHPCQLTAVKCQPNVGKLRAFFPHCQDSKPKNTLLPKDHW